MSWENILKRGNAKKAFYPLFRAAIAEVIDTYETFTLSEIIPVARESYKNKIIEENIMQTGPASIHASAQIQISHSQYLTKIINLIGTHRNTRKKNDNNELIYQRI